MAGTGDENDTQRNSNGIVQGTTGNDQIDSTYTGDPDGDQIDDGVPFSADTDDLVFGDDGDDVILTGDGDDRAYGGEGDDYIDLGAGNDHGQGGAGNDTILGGDGSDLISGGDGNDHISGGAEKDFIYGDAGKDEICGGDGDDQIYGGDDNDCIKGDAGDDILMGEGGNDFIRGGDGNDTILGGDGNDVLAGGAGDDIVLGGDGDDVLFGGPGNDFLKGFHGSDTFKVGVNEGGPYNTIVNGGAEHTHPAGEGGEPTGASNASGIDKLYVEGPVSVTLFDPNGNFVRTVELQIGDEEDLQAQGVNEGIVTLSDGSTVNFINIEQICVVKEVVDPKDSDECICFTPGTQIATIGGLVAVDALKVGDRVITRDNGYQEIRWIGRKKLSAGALAMQPHLKPVMIRAGSLGTNLPERDMMVSPQHRMLLTNAELMLHFGESEVLVAAKHLVDGRGVSKAEVNGVEYIHILFDHHEVVLADGAWTESFQPGDFSLRSLDQDARAELRELFPELDYAQGQVAYAASRPTLKAREIQMRNAMRA